MGCRQADMSLPELLRPRVAVELSLRPASLQAVTRAADEGRITDTNLYLFGRNATFAQHLYATTGRLRFECPPGDYRLYVVANRHADLGERTEAQLAALTFDYRENYDDLPMSYVGEITVPATTETLTLPPVEVRRRVAKVACNISVGANAPDIVLKSVCLCNVPRKGRLFGEGVPPASAADYTVGGYAEISPDAASRHAAVYYIPENRQGSVPGIVTQQQKNLDNAPEHAVFLLIRALRGSRVLDYRVYLGENNTTDFNVRPNTHHTLDICILGDNEVDTRVHGYTLTVWDDLAGGACGGYCPVDPQRSLYIAVEGNASRLALSGELEVSEGDTESLEFHRIGTGSYFDFEVWEPQGESYYELSYFPQRIMADNDRLSYTVTVADEYGFSQSYDFSHRYANEVRAYVKYGNVPNGAGGVTVSGALASEKIGTTQNVRAMCSGQGCTLRAVPAEGYKFAGWYKDSGFRTLLSAAQTYTYVPTVFSANLFPKFEEETSYVDISTGSVAKVSFSSSLGYTTPDDATFRVPNGSECTMSVVQNGLFRGFYTGRDSASAWLLTEETSYSFTATGDCGIYALYHAAEDLSAAGTANCYIAPKRQSGYKFDAHVTGNGRASTGITPDNLYGTRAKVIWETGPTRGAVIRAVHCLNSEICFTTGTAPGNALIGLFDERDNCLWSWHIWAADYAPEATAQDYTGGRTFMDRNLGALSAAGSDVTSRGLCYQWGRKDPFAYPAAEGGSAQYPLVYGEGFSYDCTDPMSGYGEMTVEYAAAHPWTFMGGVLTGDDRDDDAPDWLSPQHPNLWGNASTATALADTGEKSIYDPCPPGWRVPDRRAFAEADLRSASAAPGYRLLYFSAASATALYPLGGHRDAGGFTDNGKSGYVWTNAPAQYRSGTNYYKHYAAALGLSAAGIEPLARMPREKALPVRCVRE